MWTTFRGRASYDGGLTNFIPLPPTVQHGVRVCCFPSKQVSALAWWHRLEDPQWISSTQCWLVDGACMLNLRMPSALAYLVASKSCTRCRAAGIGHL